MAGAVGGVVELRELAGRVRPLVPAGVSSIPVPGPLGELLAGGALQRGVVVGVDGEPGTGRTTVALHLVAAVTGVGEWAGAVDPRGVLGGAAAAEAGVALERFGVVRDVPPGEWATVVAALLDGMTLVVAEAPPSVRAAEARRLVARARERRSTLVVVGPWPDRVTHRLRAVASTWYGLDAGEGLLGGRLLTVEGEGRGLRLRRVDLGAVVVGLPSSAPVGPVPVGPAAASAVSVVSSAHAVPSVRAG